MNVRVRTNSLLVDPAGLDQNGTTWSLALNGQASQSTSLNRLFNVAVPDWTAGWSPTKTIIAPTIGASDAIGAPDLGASPSNDAQVPEENGDASVTIAVAATGNALIDGVLSGVRWNETSITYSDTDSAADYQAGYNSDQNGNAISAQNEAFSQFTAQQMIAFHSALNQSVYTQLTGAGGFSVEGFTNLSITYNGAGTSNSTIRAANSGDAGTAYAFYPNNNVYGGDTFFGNTYDGTSNSLKNPIAGNYAWHTMIHELGHSLGLKHGHELGGPGNTAVPAAYNSVEFTVMTYSTYIGDVTGGYDYETFGAPQTYMMIDILALQTMYGADFTINSGNTVYTWDPTNGNSYVDGVLAIDPGANRIFSTIWDGDGIDTYDLSNYTTNLRLDLRPGENSTFSAAQLAFLGGGPNGGFARGNVFNAFQFGGDARSLIENANGGSGNDTITGNNANNTLNGNGGNDTLLTGTGIDVINGGDGDDWIEGGFSKDTVNGGNGNDTFYVREGEFGDDTDGGTGNDVLDLSNHTTRGAIVNLGANTYDFSPTFGGPYSIVNVENVRGTQLADTITGDALANAIDGNGGNDSLLGGAGNDSIDGGDGNDTIQGGDGDDVIIGGSGVDLMYGNAGNDTFRIFAGWTGGIGEAVFGGAGYDSFDTSGVLLDATINLQDGTFTYLPGGAGPISLSSIEKAVTGGGTDDLTGSAEANALLAGAGDDKLYGLAGNDTLGGGDGNDRMDGGAGADYLSGGTGSDTADYSSSSIGLGVSLYNPAVNTGDAAGDTYNSVENLTGSDFDDGLNGTLSANIIRGGDGNDTLKGYDGIDTLYGDGGNDILIGGEDGDALLGGAGSDTASYKGATAGVTASMANTAINTGDALGDTYTSIENITGSDFDDLVYGNSSANIVNGGAGNDILKGYAGNDTLTGGAGNDQFNFNTALNAATNLDIITDFNVAADTILLDNAIFTAIGALGTLAAAAFRANTTGLAGDATDRIIYETDTGDLLYDSDGTGAGAGVQFARLTAGLALSNLDFIVV
ncbi:M10 family metallopeptidase [Rhizobium herbae]|uniref:Serralysin n=1 Tax=Rhizobium herbae TaxID=508661 RepID=A0ABS4EFL2_9HYPH|nr:M10 family metallopeptidase [Rhizobium herbae]MBP1856739.1 serralysin [Rhizobium herbae]